MAKERNDVVEQSLRALSVGIKAIHDAFTYKAALSAIAPVTALGSKSGPMSRATNAPRSPICNWRRPTPEGASRSTRWARPRSSPEPGSTTF